MRQRVSRIYWPYLAGAGPLFVACALAGEVSPPPPGSPDDELLYEIIVTGSRIQVPASDATAPVITLTRDDIERSGKDSLGKILQSLPMSTGSQVNTNVDAGLGAARVNLRGLGSERTLVLLNGRRFPNGGLGEDASVDLNMIPVSLIERIEVLPSGASAVYGSDAIGGVVNIITRRHSGAVAIAWRTTGHDDGQILEGEANTDLNLFGGTWSLGIDYTRQHGVTNDRRSFSARPLIIGDENGTLVYAGQEAIPDGQFDVPAGNALGLEPGRYTRVEGSTGQTATDYRPYTRADSFNNSPWNYSQMPNERASVWLNGSRPFGESMEFFVEGLIEERKSAVQGSPDFYDTSGDPSPTLPDGTPGIPADNYYNPFGVDLTFVARRFVEQGVRRGYHDVDTWRAVVGLRGHLGKWNWEFSLGDAESDARTRSVGGFASVRYFSALGPSGPDQLGRIVCGQRDPATGLVPAENIVPDCVPLNLFGGVGTVTQNQLNYMSPRPLVDSGTNDQRFATAVLRGPLGHVQDRNLEWVFGAEYRREAGSQAADPLRAEDFQGLYNPDTSGGKSEFRELFAEANVPLIHERPGVLDMGLTFGARWSDFFGHNTAREAGFHWRPAKAITLRANFSTVFRAPSISELFDPQMIGTGFASDPCGNEPTPTQRPHCAASGVPGGVYVQGEDEFGVIAGGNPELQTESGNSHVFGVTYEPAWVPGLNASIDFTATDLKNVIGTAEIDTLLFECAERGSATACSAIRRFPDGSPSLVAGGNRNLGGMETSAIDFSVDWSMTNRFGELSTGLQATYLDKWDDQVFVGEEVFHHAGMLTLPRWRATGHVNWERGPWAANYSAEYIGSMTEEVQDFPPLGIVFEPYLRKVPSILYHDVTGQYQFHTGLRFIVVIENITDKDPPFVNLHVPENTDAGMYRLLGRSYRFALRYEFK